MTWLDLLAVLWFLLGLSALAALGTAWLMIVTALDQWRERRRPAPPTPAWFCACGCYAVYGARVRVRDWVHEAARCYPEMEEVR